jgi:hypothetical protein
MECPATFLQHLGFRIRPVLAKFAPIMIHVLLKIRHFPYIKTLLIHAE